MPGKISGEKNAARLPIQESRAAALRGGPLIFRRACEKEAAPADRGAAHEMWRMTRD
jgi:hypothetical protein